MSSNGSSPVAEQILECWQHDRGSLKFFRSSANFLYVFGREGQRCFLRFADCGERTREAVDAEVDLLWWLADTGVTVAAPTSSRGGNLVETVATDGGTFHAAVFPALPGRQLEVEELNIAGFERWGAALGALHRAMTSYAGPALAARSTWRDQLTVARAAIPQSEHAVWQELRRVEESLLALPADQETYGLIHGDFELDNLCWQDSAVGILDFDDCSLGWHAADIAFALRDLFGEGDASDPDDRRYRAFVLGYSRYSHVDQDLQWLIPTFLRMFNVVTYARLARAMDLPDSPEYPDWLRHLRRKLVSWMETYRASLG